MFGTVATGLALYEYFEGKNFAENARLYIKKISFDVPKMEHDLFQFVWIKVDALISNPTPFMETASDIILSFKHSGTSIVTIKRPEPIELTPFKKIPITFNIQISIVKFLTEAGNIVNDIKSGKKISFDVTGQIKFVSGIYNVNEKILAS